MTRYLALLLVLAASAPAAAQDPAPAPPTSSVSVYLDCQTFGCDFDYFRTELGMVDWVRDRAAADIHILVTGQTTGSGGQEFTVAFIGLRQFAGIMDTLKYVSPPSSTEDERRKGLAGLFRLGFVRYFARIPQGAKLTINFGETPRANQAISKKDPWNAWVFRLSVNGFGYGEESYTDRNFNYNVNMDRVTSTWKTQIRLRENRSESRQDLVDCDTSTPPVCTSSVYVTKRQNYNRTALQTRSVNQHVSVGIRGANTSSRFENHKQVFRVFPAVEYNVFPYSQSTRRQLRFEYNLGYAHYSYNDTTIFDKMKEGMPIQRLLIGFVTKQPWGTIDIGSNATHYLDVSNRYRLGIGGEFDIRLFKGFNFNVFGDYTKVKDQFNLAKKDFSQQDILTRQFQIGSDYNYFMGFGISYTFGSVFNSVVNPRMTSGNF